MGTTAAEFARLATVTRENGLAAFEREISKLWAKQSAAGRLNSGSTLIESGRLGTEAAKALTIRLLNDYEAATQGRHDRPLFENARRMALQFCDDLWPRWKTDRLRLPASAEAAGRKLADETKSEVEVMFDRHLNGLEVDGVTRVLRHSGTPTFEGLEDWSKANPGLLAVLAILAALVAGLLALFN